MRIIAYVLIWCLVMNTSAPMLLALVPGDLDPLNPATGVLSYDWTDPANTVVNTDHGAIIDWSNFNTATGESVTFNQFMDGSLNNASAVLNRITSASATQFDGALIGNGRVFVVNPAGVIFGAGSTVNVSELVVSGLGMTNGAFLDAVLNGNPMVFAGGAGHVETRGTIEANSIYLVGKKVSNGYKVFADGGLIVVAAGENVSIVQDGSNVVVEVSEGYYGDDTTADILNGSSISAVNGRVVLAAGDNFSRAICNLGHIDAGNGTITASAARIEQFGKVYVEPKTDPGNAGSIRLTGVEEVVLGSRGEGEEVMATLADAGRNGNGGSITVEAIGSEGTVTIEDGHLVSARGGSTTGDGGKVKITAEHFVIDGEIDASPQNPDYVNGTLTIDPPAGVTVVDEVDYVPGTPDTIHTGDIETLSTTGTNLIVHADNSVTVKNLVDGIIGGRGDIKFETGPGGAVTFEDPSDTDGTPPDTISTTTGSIGLSAGAGGIVAGNLETGDPGFVPGQINVETTLGSGGSVTVENLKVRDGQNSGQINVKADGNLTVNGTVAVGSVNPIDNNVSGGNVEAKVKLESGDDMALKGGVAANSHATGSGDATSSVQLLVGVEAGSQNHGTAGNLDVQGGDLVATAQADAGTSYALVEVETYGTIDWHGHQASATADVAHVEGTETKDQVDGSDKAELIITVHGNLPELEGLPDSAVTHMGDPVIIDVLANDNEATGATKDTDPTHGTVVQNPDGTFTYTPVAGYKGDDSFTYTATDGVDTTGPVTVTITMNNVLPDALPDTKATHMNDSFNGSVPISDPDNDPVHVDDLTVALVTDVDRGTLTLNSDGTYSYEPEANSKYDVTFTYSVTDGEIGAIPDTDTVTISVTNELPNANPDTSGTHMNTQVNIDVKGNDADNLDGNQAGPDTINVVQVGTPSNGTAVLNGDGSVTYTPNEDFVGTDNFTYNITDGQLDGAPVQGTVNVTVGNQAPQAVDDEVTTIAGSPVSGNVLTNDTDPDWLVWPDANPQDALFVVLDGQAPTNGKVELNPDGTFTYTPNPGFVGEDTFLYEVNNGPGTGEETSTGRVTICVEPNPAPSISPVAPGLERREVEYSGCPALVKWVSKELGTNRRTIDIWMTNALASSRDIQPFETYARLRTAAVILKDVGGSHIAALTQVINEFASSTAPPTEEQMASIADAIASNAGADNQYGIAEEYLNALAQYIGILNAEMGLSMEEAVEFATANYVNQLAERGNANVAAYVTAKLAEL